MIAETLFLVCLILILKNTEAIIGYDCGGAQYKSYLRYSAVNVQSCPAIEGWFKQEIPVDIQLIRVPKKEKVKVYVCDVRVTTIARFCGRTDSLLYGTPLVLQRDAPHLMTKSQCQNLVYNQQMEYEGEVWTSKKKFFTKDVVTIGSRDAQKGTCKAGPIFKKNNKTFTSHFLRNIVTVHIKEFEIEYVYRDQTITLKRKPVDLSEEYHSSDSQVMVWKNPYQSCEEGSNMKQMYSGAATLFKPSNPDLPDMVLVNKTDTNQVFGIEIGQPTSTCRYDMYDTNLLDVKITLNYSHINDDNSWKVPGLDETSLKHVDPVQDIKALSTFNFANSAKKLSTTISELAKESCETKRRIKLTQLSIMRLNANEGSHLLFGFGFNAILRGSTFLIYQCEERDFQYRHVEEDYEDVPVSYQINGTQYSGFLDSITFKLKSSSYSYDNNGFLPVIYNFENSWKCKQSGLIDCSTPEVLPHNFDELKNKLKLKHNDAIYDGGIDDIKDRERFRITTNERPDIQASSINIAHAVTSHENEDNIYNKFNLDEMHSSMLESSWIGNSWALSFKVIGAIVTALGICFGISRYFHWKKASPTFRENLWNLVHLFCNPVQFFSNLNMIHHEDFEDEMEKIVIHMNKEKTSETDDSSSNTSSSELDEVKASDISQRLELLANSYYSYPDQPTPPPPLSLTHEE